MLNRMYVLVRLHVAIVCVKDDFVARSYWLFNFQNIRTCRRTAGSVSLDPSGDVYVWVS